MKNLNKNQWIAVFASLALLVYLFYASSLLSLFDFSASSSVEDQDIETLETGFVVQEVAVGDGPIAGLGDTLTAHYVGTLENGQVFDSSIDRGAPIIFNLGRGQVIRGWDEGLVGMRVGGRRVLIIAPDYGYGDQGTGTIPPNSTLFFEIELLDVEKS